MLTTSDMSPAGLGGDLGVDVGQIRRVEPDLVLDENDRLDTTLEDVVLGVESILHLLDHGQQRLDIALPQEGPVENARLPKSLEPRELPGVGNQETDGELGVILLEEPDKDLDLHVGEARSGHDHVELSLVEDARMPRRRRPLG